MLVLRAEDPDQALEGLFSEILVDGLTLPQIIKHNEGILRLARDGGDISSHKFYMLYFGMTLRQLYEVRL